MFKQPVKEHLKEKYAAHINGPILFTAPHSKQLNRGGKDYGESLRIHKRQIYTSFLACDFALSSNSPNKNSFMFWGKSRMINKQDLDPNYLMSKHFSISPFHQCLHHWAIKHSQKPILHIDIHGKMDRKYNCQVDIGIESMKVHWHGSTLIPKIIDYFNECNHIFANLKFGSFQCKFNTNPDLHGYWGGDIHTMTQQAILLQIPSIQVEIPMQVRKKLFKNQEFRQKFRKIFNELYNKIIIPHFQSQKRKPQVQKQIGIKFVETINGNKALQQLYLQVKQLETKEQSNPNQNKFI